METLWTKSRLAAFGSEMASSGLLLRLSTWRYGIWTDGSVLDSSACRNLLGEEAVISLFPKHTDAAELVKQQGIRSATAAAS